MKKGREIILYLGGETQLHDPAKPGLGTILWGQAHQEAFNEHSPITVFKSATTSNHSHVP